MLKTATSNHTIPLLLRLQDQQNKRMQLERELRALLEETAVTGPAVKERGAAQRTAELVLR